jgi:hypothetical protein
MPLLVGLESCWELEETSGTRVDGHGANDLADNNTVTSGAGKVGNAASFAAASSEYLSRAANSSLQVGATDWAFSFWVKLASKSDYQALISRVHGGDSSKREYRFLYRIDSDRFYFDVWSSGGAFLGSVTATHVAPSTDTWYHIYGGFEVASGTMSISVNNNTLITATTTGGAGPGNTDAKFTIGGQENASGVEIPTNGMIDQVFFWKKILTADEHTQVYNGGDGITLASLADPDRRVTRYRSTGWR